MTQTCEYPEGGSCGGVALLQMIFTCVPKHQREWAVLESDLVEGRYWLTS